MNSELVAKVVGCFEEARNAIERDELKKKIRTRARNLATDVYYHGAAYVIALCAARSKREAIEKALSASDCKALLTEIREVMKDAKDEELSYAVYGAILVHALKSVGHFRNSKNLKDVLEEAVRASSVVDAKASLVAHWIKLLAEASFPVER